VHLLYKVHVLCTFENLYQWSRAGQLLEQSRRPEDGAGELARHHAQIRRPRTLGLMVLVQEEEREDLVLIESLRLC
jgi:hypothetical protein